MLIAFSRRLSVSSVLSLLPGGENKYTVYASSLIRFTPAAAVHSRAAFVYRLIGVQKNKATRRGLKSRRRVSVEYNVIGAYYLGRRGKLYSSAPALFSPRRRCTAAAAAVV